MNSSKNSKGIRTLKDLEELCIEAGGDYYLAKTYLKLYKLSKEDKDVYLAKAKEVATRIGANDLIKDIMFLHKKTKVNVSDKIWRLLVFQLWNERQG